MGIGISLTPLLMSIWFVLVGVTGLVALWRCATPGRSDDGPRCGACDERLTGSGVICEQCGADLRRVGISTPAMAIRQRAPRGVLVRAIIAYAVGLFFGGLMLISVLGLFIPAIGGTTTAARALALFGFLGGGLLLLAFLVIALLKRRSMLRGLEAEIAS